MTDILVSLTPIAVTTGSVLTLILLIYQELRSMRFVRRDSAGPAAKLPSTTLILTVGKDAASVENTLLEFKQSNTRQLDIVMVRSSASLAPKVLKEICEKSGIEARIYSPRAGWPFIELVKKSYDRSKRGQYIVVADTDHVSVAGVVSKIHQIKLHARRAVSIPVLSDGPASLLTVIESLFMSFKRRYNDMVGRRHTSVQALNIVYAMSSTTFKQAESSLRYESISSIRLRVLRRGRRVSVVRSKVMQACFVVASLWFIALSTTAINGNGLEAFTFTWVTLALLGCIVVWFDSHSSGSDRVAVLACAGFVPLLLLISLPLTIREKSITP